MKSFYKTLRWEISFSRHRLPSIKLREAWPLNENCSDQLVRKLNQPALHFSQTLGLLVSRDWIQFRVTNYTFIFIKKKIGLCLDSTSYTCPKIILVKMPQLEGIVLITRMNILLAKNHITVIWNTAKRTLALEWLIQYRCIYYFTQISIFCKEYIALQFTWKFYSKSNILNVSGIYLKYISNLKTEISQNSKVNYQVQFFALCLLVHQ